ncbi:MAG: LacI family DNA-binding transcriptional regulator [Opitutales bacterium]|nr:LacI family DNA-binding transcriptional regulator [Opitutales bacterium]
MGNTKKKRTSRAATLADVGREAGVSAMAASSVLNRTKSSSRISQETRERILEAARMLNYRPNVAARALQNRRMNNIGVAVMVDYNELNPYFLEVFNGIVEAADKHDQNTTVFTLKDWTNDLNRLIGFCDGRIDGMIMVGPLITPEFEQLVPLHTPFVSLHSNSAVSNVINIESFEGTGSYEMTRYLLDLGHKRILNVTGHKEFVGIQRRVQGHLQALEDAQIPHEEDLVVYTELSIPGGHKAMSGWLKRHRGEELPEAIVCGNDSIAIGCMEVLAKAGIRIPQDISICGFDDSIGARTTVPQLSSIRQPLRQMGAQALEVLLQRINTMEAPDSVEQISKANKLCFDIELVHRASVSKPRTTSLIIPALND